MRKPGKLRSVFCDQVENKTVDKKSEKLAKKGENNRKEIGMNQNKVVPHPHTFGHFGIDNLGGKNGLGGLWEGMEHVHSFVTFSS